MREIPVDAVPRITVSPKIVRYSVETLMTNPIPLSRNEVAFEGDLREVNVEALDLHDVDIVAGRMPTRGAREAMIGEAVNQHHPEKGIGSTIRVHELYDFTIVGIFRGKGQVNGETWTSREALANEAGKPVSVIYLQTANEADAKEVGAEIKQLRGLNLDTPTLEEMGQHMMEGVAGLFRLLGFVFGLMIVGAMLAASGTLMLRFIRRVSDVSVLRVFGVGTGKIAMLMLAETELLVLTGPVIGTLAAWLLLRGRSMEMSANFTYTTFTPADTGLSVLITFAVMAFIGACAALVPIIRMRRIPITDGLREE
jgi:ABC-type antimicrobial peptide transport system permease subunit